MAIYLSPDTKDKLKPLYKRIWYRFSAFVISKLGGEYEYDDWTYRDKTTEEINAEIEAYKKLINQ